MAYTSEQYKYLLLKLLQRHFSMQSVEERNYTYAFFGKLFDESVTLTEETYNAFVDVLYAEMSHCADNDIRSCSEIPVDEIESHSLLLIAAFAAVGITLEYEITRSGGGSTGQIESGKAIFTKSDGTVLTYTVAVNGFVIDNGFFINAKSRTEYDYAKRSAPYYNMEYMEVLNLNEQDTQICGVGCYWWYDSQTATMRISGDGVYYAATRDEQLGSGNFSTLVFGANVSRLTENSITDANLTTIVFLHSEDFPLVLDEWVVDRKTVHTLDIYADNASVRNYVWEENVHITLHSLDEWEG